MFRVQPWSLLPFYAHSIKLKKKKKDDNKLLFKCYVSAEQKSFYQLLNYAFKSENGFPGQCKVEGRWEINLCVKSGMVSQLVPQLLLHLLFCCVQARYCWAMEKRWVDNQRAMSAIQPINQSPHHFAECWKDIQSRKVSSVQTATWSSHSVKPRNIWRTI